MRNKERFLMGCIAENSPKYLGQALRLLQSVRWFGGSVQDANFIVCVVEEVDSTYQRRFEALGAEVCLVERFSKLHPQSNKLRFLELKEASEADRVILLDCDTLVVKDPSPFFTSSNFQAKIADLPTVSHQTFQRLFAAFDLPIPPRNHKCSVYGEPTIPYFNAGVLVLSRFAVQTLVPKWIRLNWQLIEKLELLGEEKNFCEQASLSLAMVATGIDFSIFDNEMNFPAHFADARLKPVFGRVDPAIIHYHWLVDQDGYLLSSPYSGVDYRIKQFNSRLKQVRNQ